MMAYGWIPHLGISLNAYRADDAVSKNMVSVGVFCDDTSESSMTFIVSDMFQFRYDSPMDIGIRYEDTEIQTRVTVEGKGVITLESESNRGSDELSLIFKELFDLFKSLLHADTHHPLNEGRSELLAPDKQFWDGRLHFRACEGPGRSIPIFMR